MSYDHTIKKATTSKIVEVMLRDSSTGAGKTALGDSDVTASYVREAGTRTAISLASASAGDSYSSGSWAEVDSSNCPGLYALHVPNASLATGADAVTVFLKASGVIDKVIRISLIDADLRNSTTLGLTNLDAAISSRSTFDYSSEEVTVGTNNDKSGYSISGSVTTANASDVTAIKAVTDNLPNSGALTDLATATNLATVDSVVDSILVISNKLDSAMEVDGSVSRFTTNALEQAPSTSGLDAAGVRSAIGLSTNNLDTQLADIPTVSEFEARTLVSSAYFDASTDTVTTANASDVTSIKSVTDNLPNSGSLSDLATASALATVDSVVDGIKLVTDNLPNSGALTNLATATNLATVDSVVDSILVISNKLDSAMEVDGSVSRFTTNALEQAPSGGGGGGDATASNQSTIITHLTDIKGSGFASTDTLEAIRDRGDSAWTTGGSGGGIYSLTVTCQDSSGNAVANVRVNIDGTTTTLVTNSSGQCVFNLDAGTYSLVASPPSEFNTPADTSVTVSADGSQTITLTQASTSGSAGWVG